MGRESRGSLRQEREQLGTQRVTSVVMPPAACMWLPEKVAELRLQVEQHSQFKGEIARRGGSGRQRQAELLEF